MRVFTTGWSDGYDGPGRRWMVYLKGCNFACRWCANPEGMAPGPEIMFYAERAANADRACPHGAACRDTGAWRLDRERCASCAEHECTTVWKHPAFTWAGTEIGVERITGAAARFRPLFARGGGVTFGGGEPTLQMDELLRALRALRGARVHVAVETNASTQRFADLVGAVDVLICDMKCATSETHLAWTGAPNDVVLANLSRAAREAKALVVRVPFVSGMNDSADEAEAIAQRLATLSSERTRSGGDALDVEILPLHHTGSPKYGALGRQYPMAGVEPPAPERVEALVSRLVTDGVRARRAGTRWDRRVS